MIKTRFVFANESAGQENGSPLDLQPGARVAVMGGGPAGSLFGFFLLDLAARKGLSLYVDIYEPRDFSQTGPAGCNMCAGIISESLSQHLAMEGINLPPDVVQRGMDTYVLHTSAGTVRLTTPQNEKRIGTVFRGSGPRGAEDSPWRSFDGFLLEQAAAKGANVIRARVEDVNRTEGFVHVKSRGGSWRAYDFLAVATGVNTNALRLFRPLDTAFMPPETTQTFIREYFVGQQQIDGSLGEHTIHFFLLDMPGLDFAAIVPKGDYVTICLLGQGMTDSTLTAFLSSREVTETMPPGWQPEQPVCQCAPRINVSAAFHPFADRIVFLGDSGVSRLYKDGIGAAYRAAKAAASTAVFHGIAEEDFNHHYWHYCRTMEYDNVIGKVIFAVVRRLKPRHTAIHALIGMAASEQPLGDEQQRMSRIMWDTFTGSAPYKDIFLRFLIPAFWTRLLWHLSSSLFGRSQ